MAIAVYLLCSFAALGCAALLLRGYVRSRARLLLWSGVCFSFLTLSNLLVIVDLHVLPDVPLFWLRNLSSLVGMAFMLWGLVWDSR